MQINIKLNKLSCEAILDQTMNELKLLGRQLWMIGQDYGLDYCQNFKF